MTITTDHHDKHISQNSDSFFVLCMMSSCQYIIINAFMNFCATFSTAAALT